MEESGWRGVMKDALASGTSTSQMFTLRSVQSSAAAGCGREDPLRCRHSSLGQQFRDCVRAVEGHQTVAP